MPITRPYIGPQPACCSSPNYLKFIRTHGCGIGGKYKTFKIPDGVNVITMSRPGDNLEVMSSIKDRIFRIYKDYKKTLFMNDDQGSKLTDIGEFLIQSHKKEGDNLTIINHRPGMVMNNIYLIFDDIKCETEDPDATCKLFCFNKKPPHDIIECSPELFDVRKGGHTKVDKIYLDEFISMQGLGTYIVNVCRGMENQGDAAIKAARELSSENAEA